MFHPPLFPRCHRFCQNSSPLFILSSSLKLSHPTPRLPHLFSLSPQLSHPLFWALPPLFSLSINLAFCHGACRWDSLKFLWAVPLLLFLCLSLIAHHTAGPISLTYRRTHKTHPPTHLRTYQSSFDSSVYGANGTVRPSHMLSPTPCLQRKVVFLVNDEDGLTSPTSKRGLLLRRWGGGYFTGWLAFTGASEPSGSWLVTHKLANSIYSTKTLIMKQQSWFNNQRMRELLSATPLFTRDPHSR